MPSHEADHAPGNSTEPSPDGDSGARRRRCGGPSPARSRAHAAGRTRRRAMSTTVVDPIDVTTTDVVVIGSGAAGLSAALGLAPYQVTLLTKGRLGSSGSSPLAQGGIAAALGPDDGPDLHTRDTLDAGGGLCDGALVTILTGGAARHVQRLATLGTRFDRESDGRFALGREAAHSRSRILHANGDGTGAEIVRALGTAVDRA